jgi:hypothetical protein
LPSTKFEVKLDGRVVDLALVDVAVCEDLEVGQSLGFQMSQLSG